MRTLLTKTVGAICVLVAVPVGVEFLIAYVKAETYDTVRATAVFAVIAVVVAALLLMQLFGRQLQVLLEAVLLLGGLLSTAATGAIVLGPVPGWLSVAAFALAVAITATAACLLYVHHSGIDLLFAITDRFQQQVVSELVTDRHKVALTRFSSFDDDLDEVVEICLRMMSPEDIHWLGYFVRGKCRFHLDTLDDPQLNRFFRDSHRADRRLGYERSGRQLDWIVKRLNRYVRRLDSGVLIRTVLDVEQGSVGYYYIDKEVYVVGVTMEQSKILILDGKLRDLANEIGLLPRGWVARTPSRHQLT